jgi:hypothetical protein
MSFVIAAKTKILELLPLIFGLFLMLLVAVAAFMLFSNVRQDDATGRASTFGELFLTIAFVFLLCDYVIFHMNKRQEPEKKVYYPNIRLLCAGLLTGVGTAILYLFCRASMYFIAPASGASSGNTVAVQANTLTGWRIDLIIFITLALLLALTLWAIVRVGHSE